MKPKILLGMGTCDKFKYAEKHVFSSILKQSHKDFDFLVVDNSQFRHYEVELKIRYRRAKVVHLKRPKYFRDAVGQVRKYIVDYAVANGYDYLFFVDADFILGPDDLKNLLSHQVDFVTGVIGYLHEKDNNTTVCIPSKDPKLLSKLPGMPALLPLKYPEMDVPPFFMEIVCCGLSCCLISRRALLGMNFYVSHIEMAFLEDFIFCRDLLRKGLKLFLDKRVKPFHLHLMMPERKLRAQSGVYNIKE